MTIDKEKSIQALATLEREKQEQQHRLQIAAEAKRKFEVNLKQIYNGR